MITQDKSNIHPSDKLFNYHQPDSVYYSENLVFMQRKNPDQN